MLLPPAKHCSTHVPKNNHIKFGKLGSKFGPYVTFPSFFFFFFFSVKTFKKQKITMATGKSRLSFKTKRIMENQGGLAARLLVSVAQNIQTDFVPLLSEQFTVGVARYHQLLFGNTPLLIINAHMYWVSILTGSTFMLSLESLSASQSLLLHYTLGGGWNTWIADTLSILKKVLGHTQSAMLGNSVSRCTLSTHNILHKTTQKETLHTESSTHVRYHNWRLVSLHLRYQSLSSWKTSKRRSHL